MSINTATQFLQDIEANPELQSKVLPAFDYESGQWKTDTVIQIASGVGYEFSADELAQASNELYKGELSDEQLEMVSGGKCCCSCIFCCCCCCGSSSVS